MFERFSIGSTVTARGFNKYDLAPLGATRMSHASVEVGVSAVRLFYDAGSVWDPGQPMVVRNSLGLTFGAGDQRGEGFLTIAAAIRNSRLEPTIMFRLWGR
jgi:outer membrane protein assembly factor BamA